MGGSQLKMINMKTLIIRKKQKNNDVTKNNI